MSDLDIVLCELLGQGAAAAGCLVNSIVYGYLSVFVVQPRVYVLPALLQDFLAEHDRSRRCVWEKIVQRHLAAWTYRSTTVITEVKDAGLDP